MQGYLFKIRIVIESDGDGFYAFCPDLDCVHVYGDTDDDAFDNAKDAAVAYLAMTLRHGDPIPAGIVHWQGSIIRLLLEKIKSQFGRRRQERMADLQMPMPITA